eukprot:TRINITY_DN5377_c1_g1_i1.p1 TRINITY_DN5377_c1_g1~~TRINITY_DN5377_c1_g1_i1.p1  ORF type:complete len:557 (+),score=91.67 TRINITY_DN5377_c1_g1_i1:448-2118(+)
MQGKIKDRKQYFCAIKKDGYVMSCQDSKGITKNILLSGTFAKELLSGKIDDSEEIKMLASAPHPGTDVYAIKLIHPTRTIWRNIDYIYLLLDDITTRQRWYYALLLKCPDSKHFCHPFDDLYYNPKLSENNLSSSNFRQMMQEIQSSLVNRGQRLTESRSRYETSEFLNAFVARIFIHLHESSEIKRALVKKLTEKIREIYIENELVYYLKKYRIGVDLTITDVTIGSKPPKFSNFAIVSSLSDPAAVNYNMILQFDLSTRHNDLGFSVECKLSFESLFSIDLKFKFTLEKIDIKHLKLIIPPYPMSRMAVTFTPPTLGEENLTVSTDLKVHIGGSHGYGICLTDINFFSGTRFSLNFKDILNSLLKDAIRESFQSPNAEWFLLPAVNLDPHEVGGFYQDDEDDLPSVEKDIDIIVNQLFQDHKVDQPSFEQSFSETQDLQVQIGKMNTDEEKSFSEKSFTKAWQKSEKKEKKEKEKKEKSKFGKIKTPEKKKSEVTSESSPQHLHSTPSGSDDSRTKTTSSWSTRKPSKKKSVRISSDEDDGDAHGSSTSDDQVV